VGDSTFVQTSLALWAFVAGLFLCAVYDVFRVLRLRRKVNGLVLFLADFAFCLVCTAVMLVLFFNLSFGKVRVYAFVFAVLGFFLWRKTVGLLFVTLVGKVIDFINGVALAVRTCLKRMLLNASRYLKTKIYCRRVVKKSKHGFGMLKNRNYKQKGIKNEQETYTS